MEDNYLEIKLTPQEIVYLTKIIQSAKSKYIENIKKDNFQYVELEQAEILTAEQVEDAVFSKLGDLIKAESFGEEFDNDILTEVVDKVLTKNERLVLFSCFYEGKTTINIGETLKLDRSRISHIKNDALSKIYNKYIELGGK